MKKLYITLLLTTFLNPLSSYARFWDFLSSKEKVTICYFSLNNDKELGVSSDFIDSINISDDYDIEVKEFHTDGDKASTSFQELVDSGTKCDGLVISGHHVSSFGGGRANGELSIDFMEGLVCSEESYKWFSNIKSLWLQGCRTLGAKIIGTQDAEFHADRVSAVLEEDNLQMTRGQLARDFTTLLDKNNPLSKRYMRIFPKATVFGWTETAPGKKWKSENSFVYHMANIAHLNKGNKQEKLENPFKVKEDAQIYNELILEMLLRDDNCDRVTKRCFESKEALYTQAWINHGHAEKFQNAFMNDKLNAYPSLYGRSTKLADVKLEDLTRKLVCSMKSNEDPVLVISKILNNSEVLKYSSYLVTKYIKDIQPRYNRKIYNLLGNSKEYLSYINESILSESRGLTEKLDYYETFDVMRGYFPKTHSLNNKSLNDTYIESMSLSMIKIFERSKTRALSDLDFISHLQSQFNGHGKTHKNLMSNVKLASQKYYSSYIENNEASLSLKLKAYKILMMEMNETHLNKYTKILLDEILTKDKTSISDIAGLIVNPIINYNQYTQELIEKLLDLESLNVTASTFLINNYYKNMPESELGHTTFLILISKNIKFLSLSTQFKSSKGVTITLKEIIANALNDSFNTIDYKELFLNALARNVVSPTDYGINKTYINFFLTEQKLVSQLINREQGISQKALLNILALDGYIKDEETKEIFISSMEKTLKTKNLEKQKLILDIITKSPFLLDHLKSSSIFYIIDNFSVKQDHFRILIKHFSAYSSKGRANKLLRIALGKNITPENLEHIFETRDIFNVFEPEKVLEYLNFNSLVNLANKIDKMSKEPNSTYHAIQLFYNQKLKTYLKVFLNNSEVDIHLRLNVLSDYNSLNKNHDESIANYVDVELIQEVITNIETILNDDELNEDILSTLLYVITRKNKLHDAQIEEIATKIIIHDISSKKTVGAYLNFIGRTDNNISNVDEILANLNKRLNMKNTKQNLDLFLNFYMNTNRSSQKISPHFLKMDVNEVKLLDITKPTQIKNILKLIFHYKDLYNIKSMEKEWMKVLNEAFNKFKYDKKTLLNLYIEAYAKLRINSENSEKFDQSYHKHLKKIIKKNIRKPYQREYTIILYACLIKKDQTLDEVLKTLKSSSDFRAEAIIHLAQGNSDCPNNNKSLTKKLISSTSEDYSLYLYPSQITKVQNHLIKTLLSNDLYSHETKRYINDVFSGSVAQLTSGLTLLKYFDKKKNDDSRALFEFSIKIDSIVDMASDFIEKGLHKKQSVSADQNILLYLNSIKYRFHHIYNEEDQSLYAELAYSQLTNLMSYNSLFFSNTQNIREKKIRLEQINNLMSITLLNKKKIQKLEQLKETIKRSHITRQQSIPMKYTEKVINNSSWIY